MMMGISGIAPLIGEVTADSAAARSGFQNEDKILSINGVQTPSWTDARIALLDASLDASQPLAFQVQTASGSEISRELTIDKNLLKVDGDLVANLGFSAWWPRIEPVVGEVIAGGEAERVGMLVGDKVIAVNGQVIDTWIEFVRQIQPSANTELNLTVTRHGRSLELLITPQAFTQNGVTVGRIGIAETQSRELVNKARVEVKYPPGTAFVKAIQRTWNMSVLTLRMLGKLVTGQASLENISGPVSIAQFAGQSASIGLAHYISFIAMISISLAVLNLLPIPMLDGGHLLFFAAEAVLGKPVPERVQIWGQQIGIVLLGSLMVLAFYNDFWRMMQ